MTKNTMTKNYRIPADQLQNLEIDRNGRVTPRLHDLDPLQNTLLSVLYPGIKVASVNVPAEPLDDYEESQVENALARLVWNGIHYKQGMSAKNVGTTKLSANIATIPPGGVAYAHIHVGFELILYILEGKFQRATPLVTLL